MKIEQYSSLEESQANWQTLQGSEPHSPFQSFWYQRVFAEHFSRRQNIQTLGLFEGEELVAMGSFEGVGERVLFLGTKNVSEIPGETQDVTDCGDLLYSENGRQQAGQIWTEIQKHFQQQGLSPLQLNYVRRDSPTFQAFEQSNSATLREDAVSPFIMLPNSWEDYLSALDGKKRHELNRKFNRLEAGASFKFYSDPATEESFGRFIELHKLSDPNKARFMTPEMESFFRDLVTCDKTDWQVQLCSLAIDDRTVASVMAFVNNDHTFLYNSGFDPDFAQYSVGFLVKALLIKQSIEQGKSTYDFLR